MACAICSLKNIELQNDIERLLDINHGVISEDDKKELKSKYPDETDIIYSIKDQEFMFHWNFHQSSSYLPAQADNQVFEGEEKPKSKSLKDDIGKNEAAVLYDMMSKQMETFNRMTHKINAAIDSEDSEVSHVIINPIMCEFYKDLGASIRATVKELRDLNDTVNGKANGSLEGLKAIALAISQPAQPIRADAVENDMSTNKFDY